MGELWWCFTLEIVSMQFSALEGTDLEYEHVTQISVKGTALETSMCVISDQVSILLKANIWGNTSIFWGGYPDTLQATNISHFGKRKIIFQEVFLGRKHRCFGREVSFSKSAGCQVQS